MRDLQGQVIELVQGNWHPHIAVNWYSDGQGNYIEAVEDKEQKKMTKVKAIKAFEISGDFLEKNIIIPALGGYFVIMTEIESETEYMFIPSKVINGINGIRSLKKERK